MAKDGFPLDDLRLALAEADLALTAANTPEEGRIASLLALKAFYDFLKSTGLRSRALNNLSMALQDIDRGNSPIFFAPSVQNRPRDKARLFILKAVAAAAMQLLMDSGRTKADAAAIVAKKLNLAGFSLPGLKARPASAKTIALWRDKFSGHSDEEGADAYKFTLQQARVTHTNPSQQAELVMGSLKRFSVNLDKSPS
jgi:hypothetical protein